jgi:general secretion pathway protein D
MKKVAMIKTAFRLGLCVWLLSLGVGGSSSLMAADKDRWTVNFNNTDIRELIKFVADATGKTIIVDPQVKGKVEVVSQRPLSTAELYDLFLSILKVHGYAAVDSNGVLKIIDEKGARTQASDVTRTSNSADYITHVIQLENVAAAKLIPVLRPLVPQQAHLAAYAPSNAIIITDSGDNIERIRQIIRQIDTAAVEQTNVIRLKHASADEVVTLINRLEQQNKGNAAEAGSSSFSVVADKRTNSVLVTGDEVQRARIRTMVRYLDVPLESIGNANVIYLEYANALDVAEVLSRVTDNLSKIEAENAKDTSGKTSAVIEADEATNALIITADPDVMQTITAVIAKLDIRRAQVLVEAILVEVSNINDKELGIEWLFGDKSGAYGANASPPSSGAGLLAATTVGILEDDTGLVGAALASTPGLSFGIGRVDKDGLNFNVLVKALQEENDTNILSTPSLLTLDNNEATIVVGQEVPFVTGSFTSTGTGSNPNNPFQTIERKDVGITLKVTPHINEGDSIVMEIVQEISSLTELVASDVITNKREITTTVLADDGDTVVLGGLIRDDLVQAERKVPLLGDIPWLGRLFRNSGTRKEKTNLMVFLRSTIVRDSRVLNGATGVKYNHMREQQLRTRDDGVNLMDDDVMPILPAWRYDELDDLDRLREDAIDAR